MLMGLSCFLFFSTTTDETFMYICVRACAYFRAVQGCDDKDDASYPH